MGHRLPASRAGEFGDRQSVNGVGDGLADPLIPEPLIVQVEVDPFPPHRLTELHGDLRIAPRDLFPGQTVEAVVLLGIHGARDLVHSPRRASPRGRAGSGAHGSLSRLAPAWIFERNMTA